MWSFRIEKYFKQKYFLFYVNSKIEMTETLVKALTVELLGTAILVFIGCAAAALTAAQGGSLLVSALAFGLAYLSVYYAWGQYWVLISILLSLWALPLLAEWVGACALLT